MDKTASTAFGLSGASLNRLTAGVRPVLRRGRGAMLAALLALGIGASAPAADSGITTAHGFAAFGEMRYGPDFTHFDYVNPDAPKGGVVTFGQTGYFDNFNSFAITGNFPFGLTLLYDRLMQLSPEEPATTYGLLAESISYPKDLSWIEFRLRPEARFANGDPVRPEDVIFTIETFQDNGGPLYRRIGSAVKRVYKTGPRSVRMEMAERNNPSLVSVVSQSYVIPQKFFEGRDFIKGTLDVPYGSGPYAVEDFSPGRWIRLKRREDYWAKDLPVNRGRYNMDVHTDYYRDGSVHKDAFLSGEYDFRTDRDFSREWDYENRLRAFRRGDIKRDSIPYSRPISYQAVIFNTRTKFLSDRRVRQALTHAYDFEWFQKNILYGHHDRVSNYFDNSEFSFSGLPSEGELAFLEPWRDQLPAELFERPFELPVLGTRERQRANLLKAQSLLRDAGYVVNEDLRLTDPDTGQPVELDLMLGYGIVYENYISEWVQNLDRLGIKVNVRLYDNSTVRQLTARYDFDLRISIPNLQVSLTPGPEMLNEYSSAAASKLDSRNLSGVADPVVDDMLEKMLKATTREQVVDSMRALNRVLMWDYYSIPLAHVYPDEIGKIKVTYWDRFGRPPAEPEYLFPFYTLDHWWIDKQKSDAIDRRLGKRR